MISARRLIYTWTFAGFFGAMAIAAYITTLEPPVLVSLAALAFAAYAAWITVKARQGVARDVKPLDLGLPVIAGTIATTSLLLAVAVRQGAYAWLLSIPGA